MIESKRDEGKSFETDSGSGGETHRSKKGPAPAVRGGVGVVIAPKSAPTDSVERPGGRIPLK